jgi:DNA-binding NarL/FixJ family response regulator
MTTVLIADDQPLQRLGFRMLLDGTPGFTFLGEASHGGEAVREAERLRPDVVLMDVRMPGMDGIEATRRITAAGDRTRVLILTTFDLDEYVYAGLRAGASGFLLKDARPEELLAGIRAVATGDAVVAPSLTRRLMDAYTGRNPAAPPPAAADPRLAALSEREREVLVAIGNGWTNTEIAERLVLTESTVKKHVGRVLAKVGARDRIQAVIFAYDAGLVRPRACYSRHLCQEEPHVHFSAPPGGRCRCHRGGARGVGRRPAHRRRGTGRAYRRLHTVRRPGRGDGDLPDRRTGRMGVRGRPRPAHTPQPSDLDGRGDRRARAVHGRPDRRSEHRQQGHARAHARHGRRDPDRRIAAPRIGLSWSRCRKKSRTSGSAVVARRNSTAPPLVVSCAQARGPPIVRRYLYSCATCLPDCTADGSHRWPAVR